ncbi:MAG: type II secretion system protein GspD [Bryobacteraceae bacterium]
MPVFRLLVCFVLLSVVTALAASPGRLFRKARKAEKRGNPVEAYALYSQAAAAEPANRKYWAYTQAIRRRALLEARPELPPLEAEMTEIDPEVQAELDAITAPITEVELADALRPQPPKQLKASLERKSFDLKLDSKSLFEEVAAAYDLDVIFDGDYQPGQPVRFTIEDVDYREALYALEAATGSFLIPIGERLIMVVKDTPQKRQEVEPTMAIVIPIPEPVSVQDAQELARNVQQTMELQKLQVDTQRRLILVRDRVSRIRPAEAILHQLLQHRPQVVIEAEFLAVARNSSLDIGLRLPDSFPILHFGKVLGSVPKLPANAAQFATFGGGSTLFGIGLASADLFARFSRSSGTVLLQSELRSLSGQPASLHIGDRFPIMTQSFLGSVPGDSDAILPPPTVHFEDLGVVLKITPHVHGMDEISLDIESEFKVLTGVVLNGIPVIANRQMNVRVRMREGEWGVLAGLVTAANTRSVSGIAGLMNLPILGPLFRQTNTTQEYSEVLMVLKPKLVNVPPSEALTKAIWVGTESRPRSQL